MSSEISYSQWGNWTTRTNFNSDYWLKLSKTSDAIPVDSEVTLYTDKYNISSSEDEDFYSYSSDFCNNDTTIAPMSYVSSGEYVAIDAIYYRPLVYPAPDWPNLTAQESTYSTSDIKKGFLLNWPPYLVGCNELSWGDIQINGNTFSPNSDSYVIYKIGTNYYGFQLLKNSFYSVFTDTNIKLVSYWGSIQTISKDTTGNWTNKIEDSLRQVIYNTYYDSAKTSNTSIDRFAAITDSKDGTSTQSYWAYVKAGYECTLSDKEKGSVTYYNASILLGSELGIGEQPNNLKGYAYLKDIDDISSLTESSLLLVDDLYWVWYTPGQNWSYPGSSIKLYVLWPGSFLKESSTENWILYNTYNSSKEQWEPKNWFDPKNYIFSQTEYSGIPYDYIKVTKAPISQPLLKASNYYDNSSKNFPGKNELNWRVTYTYIYNIERLYKHNSKDLLNDNLIPLQKTSLKNDSSFSSLGSKITDYSEYLSSINSATVAVNSNYGVQDNSNSILFGGVYSRSSSGSYRFQEHSSHNSNTLNFISRDPIYIDWKSLGFDEEGEYSWDSQHIYWNAVPIFDATIYNKKINGIIGVTPTISSQELYYKNGVEGWSKDPFSGPSTACVSTPITVGQAESLPAMSSQYVWSVFFQNSASTGSSSALLDKYNLNPCYGAQNFWYYLVSSGSVVTASADTKDKVNSLLSAPLGTGKGKVIEEVTEPHFKLKLTEGYQYGLLPSSFKFHDKLKFIGSINNYPKLEQYLPEMQTYSNEIVLPASSPTQYGESVKYEQDTQTFKLYYEIVSPEKPTLTPYLAWGAGNINNYNVTQLRLYLMIKQGGITWKGGDFGPNEVYTVDGYSYNKENSTLKLRSLSTLHLFDDPTNIDLIFNREYNKQEPYLEYSNYYFIELK